MPVYGDVIVTLADIARGADIAELPGETMPLRIRQAAAEGDLAVMELSTPGKAIRNGSPPIHGGACIGRARQRHLPVVSCRPGPRRPSEPDERFTVTLDGRLGEDQTASGSPVVAGDAVVGIVGPVASNEWVSAFGADVIRRLLATYAAGPPAGS